MLRNLDEPSTLIDLLRFRASRDGGRIAYRWLCDGEKEQETLTYAELEAAAMTIAGALQSAGFEGQRVLLLYPPGLEFVKAFLGCLYAGAIAVPVYPPRHSRYWRRLQSIAADAQAKLALSTKTLVEKLQPVEFAENEYFQWIATDGLSLGNQSLWREPAVCEESMALLQYTSGSTSSPRGVVITHKNILSNEGMIQRAFGQGPDSIMVSWLPMYHDMGLIGGILQPLYSNSLGILMSPVSFLQQPLRWLEAISTFRATTSGGPNFAYDLCVERISSEQRASLDLSCWNVAYNGAEPIRAGTLERFSQTFAASGFRREAFRTCYGLAEATLLVASSTAGQPFATFRTEPRSLERHLASEGSDADPGARSLISSGCVAEQKVIIAHPDTGVQCQAGHIGEVWVSGSNVAQGYWNRPEETAHTFGARRQHEPESMFMRTGDLGFISQQQLFITGRLKDLLIVRGVNHYPQDIEFSVQNSHEVLHASSSAAFAVTVGDEDRVVVAQEISRGYDRGNVDVLIHGIRRAVAEEQDLQLYAIVLVRKGGLPKTSSGKIQRYLCRELFLKESLPIIAEWRESRPAGEQDRLEHHGLLRSTESAEQWLELKLSVLLGVKKEQIEMDRPLVSLGLDSIRCFELIHELEKQGVAIGISELLAVASLSELARLVRRQYEHPPLPKRSSPPFPEGEGSLSYGQQALWFMNQLAPAAGVHNLAIAARVAQLDVSALQWAVDQVVARHESLRTSFYALQGKPARQVRSAQEVRLEVEQNSEWDAKNLDSELSRCANIPFDLEKAPLARVQVFWSRSGECALLIVLHHLIADFWSLAILLREVGQYYSIRHSNSLEMPALSPLSPRPYLHYVNWQKSLIDSTEGDGHLQYWRERLSHTTILNLPSDRPRPAAPTFAGGSHTFRVSTFTTTALKYLARRGSSTLFAALLATFQALLYRYTRQPDIGVGLPAAGRAKAMFAGMVGHFVNPVVLRSRVSPELNFMALTADTGRLVANSLEHQEYPFQLLVEKLKPCRDSTQTPFFQVMFAYFAVVPGCPSEAVSFAVGCRDVRVKLGDLELECIPLEAKTLEFNLIAKAAHIDDELAITLHFSRDLFDPATIHRFAGHWQRLIEDATAFPSQRIDELSILSSAEREHLVVGCNDTAAPYPMGMCIHELVAEQARRTPGADALVCGIDRCSYRQLDERSNRLARYLQSFGAGPDIPIGICMERSVDMVVALLAILKSGSAYLPLDPQYPLGRLLFLLEDAQVHTLVTKRAVAAKLKLTDVVLICLDDDSDAIAACACIQPSNAIDSSNLAYVIYTSGSSGTPKGTMISHRSVVNFMAAMDSYAGAGPAGVWLAVTSISFDISVLELFWTLSRGFQVVIGIDALFTLEPGVNVRQKKPIDFSLFYFASDSEDDGSDLYNLLIEGSRFADRHGFAAIWTPERHFHKFGGLYPNPSVTGAALAMATERIQIRAGSVVLPLHDPVRVAEEWSVVDNLSGGRVGISFASGWHADDFVLAPEKYAGRREAMWRDLDVVRRLWRGEPVKRRGGTGKDMEIKIRPRPLQPELPLWITAAGNEPTFKMAGEIGANILTHLLGQSLQELTSKIDAYRESFRRHNPDSGDGHVTLMLHTFLGEDRETVKKRVREPFCNYLRDSADLIANLAVSANSVYDVRFFPPADLNALLSRAFERYFESSGLFGTPDDCISMIERLEQIGVNEVACLIDFGVDRDAVMESLGYLDALRRRCLDLHAGKVASRPVTHLQCTPSMASMLQLSGNWDVLKQSIQKVMLGGEALPLSVIDQLQPGFDGQMYNMYGPTETTVWSATDRVDSQDPVVTLGRPIANTRIYVLDSSLCPVPVGVPGQIHICGEGLARGYWRRPGLTAEKFVPDPFGADSGARMYCTGDIGRFRPDGRIDFLGRIDRQVKIRGHRIELGEIEQTLGRQMGVQEAAVIAHRGADGEVRLIACVIGVDRHNIPSDELRAFMGKTLPDFMVPETFHWFESFPKTPNGKLDRDELASLASSCQEIPRPLAGPRNALERVLARLWAEVLSLDRVEIDDSYFKIGGHSLLAAQLIARLRTVFRIELPLVSLFHNPTVVRFAAFMVLQNGELVTKTAEILEQVSAISEIEAQAMLEQNNPNVRGA